MTTMLLRNSMLLVLLVAVVAALALDAPPARLNRCVLNKGGERGCTFPPFCKWSTNHSVCATDCGKINVFGECMRGTYGLCHWSDTANTCDPSCTKLTTQNGCNGVINCVWSRNACAPL